ncbi:hypothetical protein [Lacipirellula sp.]|uniref:hypothetical protein n=1 Tax=Lacipirellula sp. TaxID=2691419 RepID=UPI003D1369FD
MSNSDSQEIELTEAQTFHAPVMRFPLRAMLLLTTGLALLAATVGPLYRQAHPEARSSVLVFWTGVLTALTLFGLFEWRGSIRRKKLVGPVRFQLKRVNRSSESIIIIMCAWVVLLYSIFSAYVLTHTFGQFQLRNGSATSTFVGICVTVFIAGASIGAYMVAAIDYVTRPWTHSGRVDIGETGVMFDRRAMQWSQVRHALWNDDYPNQLLLQFQKWNCQFAVPSSIREEVEAFVRTKAEFIVPAPIHESQPVP